MSFSEGRCLPVAEVKRVVVGCGLVANDVFNFGGDFVAVVVVVVVEIVPGSSKLEVAPVVRIAGIV